MSQTAMATLPGDEVGNIVAAARESQAAEDAAAVEAAKVQPETTELLPELPSERKLRRADIRRTLADDYQARKQPPMVRGDLPAISDDTDPEVWARIRTEQLQKGILYKENAEVLNQHRALEAKLDREAAKILEAQDLRSEVEQLANEPSTAAQPTNDAGTPPEPTATDELMHRAASVEGALEAVQSVLATAALGGPGPDVVAKALAEVEPEELEIVAKNLTDPIFPLNAEGYARSAVLNHLLSQVPDRANCIIALAKDPETLGRLQTCTPNEMAKEIFRVSWELRHPVSRTTERPPSRLPKPPNPITRSAAGTAAPRDDDDADTWMAKRRAQLAKQGRALTS